MKYMIASDIHGSSKYCKLLLDAYKKENCSRLFLLGDTLYHGPRNGLPDEHDPMLVSEMLNEYKNEISGVRGNCDCEIDQMLLQFPIMADYALIPLKTKTVFLTHGHLFNKDQLPPINSGDVLIHGHTHVTVDEILPEGIRLLNPGSVSFPKCGTGRGYIILDTETEEFSWKSIL